jgi:hypothetical protein
VTAKAGRIKRVEWAGDVALLPTQYAFASSPCRHKAYIGPLGSGKSFVLCLVCVLLAASVPGNIGVIGRYSRFDFNRTTRITLERLLHDDLVERQLPNAEGWMIRTSDPDKPSTLYTAHFDEPGPYASMELGFFGIDEVNGDQLSPSVPEPVFGMLAARLGRLRHVRRPYGLMAGNPYGHNWVWKRFHSQSAEQLADHAMFSPKPFENASNLQPDYYPRLEKTNGPEWVQRYVYGSHDVFEGQVYSEMTEDLHTCNPFEIPATWPRIISLDHGLRNPTCVGFAAIDPDGRIVVYDEHYEAGKLIEYHAEQIKRRIAVMAKAREITWVADPSIFSKTMQTAGKVYSVFDQYADAGLDEWTPGENDVKAGRDEIKRRLKTKNLVFFRGRCPNIWREMTGLHWRRLRSLEERNAPEQEADIDNHGPDMLRYLVMSRPEPAVDVKPKVVKLYTHAEAQKKFQHEHINKAVARHLAGYRGPEDDYV